MKRDELRPFVQARMELDEWPGDWNIAGQILDSSFFNFQRSQSGAQLYGITLFGKRVTGSGIDEDAVTAIFRAFLLERMEADELTRDL